MRRFGAGVISISDVMPGISLIWLAVPPEAAAAKAGQFYMVRCGEHFDPLLRRPIAYHRARFATSPYGRVDDLESGRSSADLLPGGSFPPTLDLQRLPSPFVAIAFLVAKVGRGTNWLASRQPGEILDLLGPLGAGYHVEPRSRNLLLVAGGMGIAPLVALCEEAVAQDLQVTLLLGAPSTERAYPAHLLPPQVELVLATEDGSAGTKGLVTDLLPDYLGWADQIFACGPRPMYVAMHTMISRHPWKKDAQVSIEERMACGLGACLGCSVQTRHGMKTACKDGPVFALKEVVP